METDKIAEAAADRGPTRSHAHRVSRGALGVSEAWFSKQRTRQPTRRELRGQHLVEAVKREFDESGGTYGSPKIWIRLVRQGWQVSVNIIAKIMAELGPVAREVRRWRGLTCPGKRPAVPKFVRRDFTTSASGLVWYGGMTEIETGGQAVPGHGHLSRRLLGYATGARNDAEVVVAALHMAATPRG